MAEWKPVVLDADLLSKGGGELIGIEELICPDDSLITRGDSKKKNVKERKRKVSENEGATKKKKKRKQNVEKKRRETFSGFTHHKEMLCWNEFGLRDEILAALYDRQFFQPTEIQMKCLGPAVCGFKDILGAAETGSGKTLAFGIPIVNSILQIKDTQPDDNCNDIESDVSEDDWVNDENDIGCVKVKNLRSKSERNKLFSIILTPTRELAVQVKNHLEDLCKYTNIKIVLVVGGLAHEKQERLLSKRPEVIVATPGRLWDLIQTRNVHLQEICKIRHLAIDETDRMLEKGHFEELNNILECLNANDKERKGRQNFVFSATLTLVHDPPSYVKGKKKLRITPGQKLQELIKRVGITNPKIVDITNAQVTPENLKEFKVICKFEEKDYYLYYFLKECNGKSIIFCNSIGCVKRLANLLNVLEYSPLPLHANMMQKQRLKNLEKFREKEKSILIATDVAARGLDITDVEHVLHYQVPKTAESYVHRSGRTARRKNSGNVLLLIEPEEYRVYLKLIRTLGRSNEIDDLAINSDTLNHLKQVIHLARDIDQLSLAIKKLNASKSWYSKAVEEMDMIIDEDELPHSVSDEGSRLMKDDLKVKRKKLKSFLSQPEISRKFTGKFLPKEVSNLILLNKGKSVKDADSIFKPKKRKIK